MSLWPRLLRFLCMLHRVCVTVCVCARPLPPPCPPLGHCNRVVTRLCGAFRVPRCGRCLGNFVRTIPWLSLIGFLFGIAGATTCYMGMTAFANAVGDFAYTTNAVNYSTAFLWGVAFLDVCMFVAGVFSTGRCREWCCRPVATRAKGKCSCRAFCRSTYGCNAVLAFLCFGIIVIVACLFSMAVLAIFAVKMCVEMVCHQQANLGPNFVFPLGT